jgi:hypothetical protein
MVDTVLSDPETIIDSVIIPVRDLVEATTSRIVLERQAINRSGVVHELPEHTWEHWAFTAGGAVFSLNPVDQGRILAVLFHQIIEKLTKADVPFVLLSFPRLVHDSDYLFNKLQHLLPATATLEKARQVHQQIADSKKVRVDGELKRKDGQVCTTIAGIAYPESHELDLLALRREILRLNSALQQAEANLDQSRATCGTLTAQLSAQIEELDRQSKRAAHLEIELAERKSRLDQFSSQTDLLEAQSSELRNRTAILHAQVDEQRSKLAKQQAELAVRNARISEQEAKLLERRQEATDLRTSLASTTEQCAGLSAVKSNLLMQVAESRALAACYEAERELFFRSRSWLLTKPLRAFAHSIRRLRLTASLPIADKNLAP